jgi:hypothetical protein
MNQETKYETFTKPIPITKPKQVSDDVLVYDKPTLKDYLAQSVNKIKPI